MGLREYYENWLTKAKILPRAGEPYQSLQLVAKKVRLATFLAVISLASGYMYFLSANVWSKVATPVNEEYLIYGFIFGIVVLSLTFQGTVILFIFQMYRWASGFLRNSIIMGTSRPHKTFILLTVSLLCFPLGMLFAPYLYFELYKMTLSDHAEQKQRLFLASPVFWPSMSLCLSVWIAVAVSWVQVVQYALTEASGERWPMSFFLVGSTILSVVMAVSTSVLVFRLTRLQQEKYEEFRCDPQGHCACCGETVPPEEMSCPVCGTEKRVQPAV